MYAHQVIEDVGKYEKVKFLCPLITKSHKFHIGSVDELFLAFDKLMGKNRVFLDDPQYLRLPYDMIWVDYWVDKKSTKLKHGQVYVSKRAILVIRENKNNLVSVIIFNKLSNEIGWLPGMFSYRISIGKIFDDYGGNIKAYPMQKNIPEEYVKEDALDLTTLDFFLRLLNCKNIISERISAPSKLNKKRARKNSLPLFDYHTLTIKINNQSKSSYKTNGIPINHNRIHFCRGHFKEYTEENKLFGKITGLFWWQPFVRGDNKKGIVLKDYKVNVG